MADTEVQWTCLHFFPILRHIYTNTAYKERKMGGLQGGSLHKRLDRKEIMTEDPCHTLFHCFFLSSHPVHQYSRYPCQPTLWLCPGFMVNGRADFLALVYIDRSNGTLANTLRSESKFLRMGVSKINLTATDINPRIRAFKFTLYTSLYGPEAPNRFRPNCSCE